MTVQKQNEEQGDLLAARYQMRAEPNFALANVLSTFGMLPHLRGFWPFSSIDESARAMDVSPQARHLTPSAGYTIGLVSLLPVATLAGGYLLRADEAGLDITGSLAWGGWFNPTGVAGNQGLTGKWGTAAASGGYLLHLAGATPEVVVEDGAGADVAQAGAAIGAGSWSFIAGRFTAGAELAICVNKTWAKLAAGIPAALRNNAIDFRIGAFGNPAANLLAGGAALCWLCASAPADAVINNLYEQTKVLFGL